MRKAHQPLAREAAPAAAPQLSLGAGSGLRRRLPGHWQLTLAQKRAEEKEKAKERARVKGWVRGSERGCERGRGQALGQV